ncbi:endonuclease/exonuclease/phosphatase (EEP) superfamily protein YafD [Prosthecobacter fusiformis]|uniref:Endonuclease/exonuclease/phosphatase (EEP) superfamily protein YafD n=1 Tax=Prosthecobacter fusiformis TaxID=48464 RepID=A0A4R7RLJ0_9BACT|nr:endonuclease/exonuclease/phosphatase family protein [Prosthecobacter fusiformis]TDU64525.1 endonuclease/exonuclease/phosphatase (EEP) superfamily protein YafD [Prosthecobacter fusiformis]
MPDQRRFLSSSIHISGCVDILLLLALSGTWLGLLGGLHWALDLFIHFPWQYLFICVAGTVWCFGMKRSIVVKLVCISSLLMNGTSLYRVKGDPSFAEVEGERLRVVSLNVLTGNPDKQRVFEYLVSANADVIFLMEVDSAWATALDSLKETHPHHLLRTQEDNFGVALFSRVPLLQAEVFQTSDEAMPSVIARLMHAGREMTLVGTHPLPPIGPRLSASRDTQLLAIAGYVKELNTPVLVIGDLNATPWSQGMRMLRRGNALGYRSATSPSKPTWKVGTIFAVPIDHALCTPPLTIPRRVIGPDVGSDHRPQELEVGWQPGA